MVYHGSAVLAGDGRGARVKRTPYRIAGDIHQSTHALENVAPRSNSNKRHAGFGDIAIQRALNHIQVEALVTATNVFDAWQPLCHKPSSIEEVVLFRKHVLLGKISRYEGK